MAEAERLFSGQGQHAAMAPTRAATRSSAAWHSGKRGATELRRLIDVQARIPNVGLRHEWDVSAIAKLSR